MADLTFQNTTSGTDGNYQWSDGSNWSSAGSSGTVPVTGDNVTVTAGGYISEDDIASLTLNTTSVTDGTVIVDNGATLDTSTLNNGGTIAVYGTFTVGNVNNATATGVIEVESGGHFNVTNLQGDDYIVTAGGTMVISGSGNLNSSAPIELQGGVLDIETSTAGASYGVNFSGSDAAHLGLNTQVLTNHNNASLQDLGVGDTIEFNNATMTAVSFDQVTNVLTITASGTDYTFTIGSFQSGDNFVLAVDPATGRESATVTCFYPGTGIRTPAGDKAVESLCIGDTIVTADDRILPVRWIGRNTVSTHFGDPLRVLPIRIGLGALGNGLPTGDLLLSPEHAVLVDGILVQAGALVNGINVTREKDVPETFVYYHIELVDHELILAEGAAVESFVDNVHRMAFDNWKEHEALYADGANMDEMHYPRAHSVRQVPIAIRTAVMERGLEGLVVKRVA